jgi:RND family efflux transporter MFP subunit
VKQILVDAGDRVQQGQLLAVLEAPELVADVTQATASSKHSEAEIERAQGELDRARSAHQAIHDQNVRLTEVMKKRPNLVAQQDLDDLQARDRSAEGQLAASQASLSSAREQLAASRANLDRVQTLLAYCRITAPFAGVITKRYADTGAMVQAGTASNTQAMPVVRLSENSVLRLVIPLPESIVSRVRVGTTVTVNVASLGKDFDGRVARFSRQVDTATRTMPTEVDVQNSSGDLVPGMFAKAIIQIEKKTGVLAVPVQSVSRKGEKTFVFRVAAGNKLEQREVQTGLETSDSVEIVSGIEAGDQVVVGNVGQLASGMVVDPKPWSPQSAKGGQ